MRATMAGLAKLRPSPPNISFTTMMATIAPMTGTYSGMEAGMLNESSKPVITAVRSPAVCFSLRIAHQTTSHRTQETTVTASTSRARSPKMITEATSAGTRAMITFSMMERLVSLERMWGDAVITYLPSNFSITFYPLCRVFSLSLWRGSSLR